MLCIDDNRDSADSEALLLEMCGYTASACYDGLSALAQALRFGPDVCLIDYNMPGMNGAEVGAGSAWRRADPVLLIAVTAHGTQAVRKVTAEAGFDHHFVKPLDWEALRAVLSERQRTLARDERHSGRG